MIQVKLGLILILSAFLAGNPSTKDHEYSLTITTIVVNPSTQSLEITLKIPSDQLEKSMSSNYKQKLILEELPNDSLFIDYFKSRVKVRNNDHYMSSNYVGKELDIFDSHFYFEIPLPKTTSPEIEVFNSVLMNINPMQQNIVHLQNGDSTESCTVTRGKALCNFYLGKF